MDPAILPHQKPISASVHKKSARPAWLRVRPPGGVVYRQLKERLHGKKLHTVCEEAHCPNIGECWSGGTATIMLGGDLCTRGCRFCAVKTSKRPEPLNPHEPQEVAEVLADLALTYVVLTAVDRDDLKDGGAEHFALTIRAIKERCPDLIVEALVPDFQGRLDSVRTVVDADVDVYSHNIETVERLQRKVRDPRAGYWQSLETLRLAKRLAKRFVRQEDLPSIGGPTRSRIFTKSSLMLGLGESSEEVLSALGDLRRFEVDIVTLGQYLQPSKRHLTVMEFITPTQFAWYQEQAQAMGFLYCAAGPLVRSSYRAGEYFLEEMIRLGEER